MRFNKLISLVLLGGYIAGTSLPVSAQRNDCDMHVAVIAPDDTDSPSSINHLFRQRMTAALSHDGVTADEYYGQFYLTGRFADIYKEHLPGPPAQVAVFTVLTLAVADIEGNKVFATEEFELRGVGNSEQRAYINALSSITGKNDRLRKFIESAKQKTIQYFDKNYKQLLAKARTAAGQNDYEQAMYYASLIPQCSAGYSAAELDLLTYYQADMDREGEKLLGEAERAFAADPNRAGAEKAFAFIRLIDPSSKAYTKAQNLVKDIKKQIKMEYDFEVHEKYKDDLDLRKRRIDAARQIGVAYGNGPKHNDSTNILWH